MRRTAEEPTSLFWGEETTTVVHFDPEIVSVAPVFTGTRVTIQALIGPIAAGDSIDRFWDDFPTVFADEWYPPHSRDFAR
ncbi:DUF433 domain-containing protein [Adhaeretor mobilis]|uniref:Uncharacterized protein n=1 Tax=Adhaeretor mobilis TaxID=1930276 RepID=A0A517N1K5_9BACT|nr:DUF433 domain-containing protein [Adhaeretor mobilis]QDT01011.1 hypothetical protein HG15A2_43530 [Adhaeretor mobilis]